MREKKLNLLRDEIDKENKNHDMELQAIKNLVDNAEDKYIEWENKVNKLSVKADKDEDRIKNAKERFENWRIGILEEVARMKLKKKVDNIDKAGLSEILNG